MDDGDAGAGGIVTSLLVLSVSQSQATGVPAHVICGDNSYKHLVIILAKSDASSSSH